MKILVAGDFLPKHRIQELINAQDYSFMNDIRPIIKSADYSIVNFECPVAADEAKPISKGGPNHKTTVAAVDAIKYAGFTCATLANNHFRDFGDEGCIATLDSLRNHSIDSVGGGRNLAEAQSVLYKNIAGEKLAIVNFCENEFSIATPEMAGSAPLDLIDNYYQITEARNNADYVLVIVHGGHEHYQLPSPRMKKLYRHFILLGADAVVNHHQHCYSGYEMFNGHPIVYGLGNLCFDSVKKRSNGWYEGYMVTIDFQAESKLSLHPYYQCLAVPTIDLMQENDIKLFNSNIAALNAIISDDKQLAIEFEKLVKSKERSIKLVFASYHNRYLNGAARRGYLPILTTAKELRSIGSYVKCESHLDIVQRVVFGE